MIVFTRLLVFGCVTGFCYSLFSYALRPLPNIDPLHAVGLAFALSLSALMWFTIGAFVIATTGFSVAILSLFAAFAAGLISIARAAIKPSKRTSERERIALLYPPPDPRRLILHE